MIAHIVFRSFKFLKIIYLGKIIISAGIIIAASKTRNIASLPLNFIFEKPYAVYVIRNNLMIIVMPVISTVFKYHLGKL